MGRVTDPEHIDATRRSLLKRATALVAGAWAHPGKGAGATAADARAASTAMLRPPPRAWQQLTIAPHLRRIINLAGNGTIGKFDPSKALAVEALAPRSVSGIPARAFSLVVPGEHGVCYIVGGLHSNYPGNEIDRMTLPRGRAETVIRTEISHQPNMPPEGANSGYASGNGGYIYRQYGGGTPNPADWQPYPGHQWTKNGWHPDWGFFSLTAHALTSPDGSVVTVAGIPVSSAAQPADVWPPGKPVAKTDYGVVGFDWATRRYRAHLSTIGKPFPNNLLGGSGVSDWNNWDQSIVFLHTNGGTTYIQHYRLGGDYGLAPLAPTRAIGGYDSSGGNGLLIRTLEHRKYLVLRQDGRGRFADRTRLLLYSEDFGPGDARFKLLALPAAHTADVADGIDGLSFTVDRNSRRVFWLVFPGVGVPVRFYVSSFEALENWREISFDSPVVVPNLAYHDAWLAGNRQPMIFRDGYLFLVGGSAGPGNPGYTDGAMNWTRVKVDAGEDLPEMRFRRFDYRKQSFRFSHAAYLQLWGNKHSNWACRTATGEHYLCGGDLGGSFNPSMAKLKFDGSPRGYTFTELLNETQPAPPHPATGARQKRPASPDDGYWFYCSPDNAEPALRDKFVYARGGDGIGFVSNTNTRQAYVSHAANRAVWLSGASDAAAEAAMQADGWTMDRLVIYDPATNGFAETHVADWPLDDGGSKLRHPSTLGAQSSRCGAFDESTNHLFRFTVYDGSMWLLRYDLARRAIKAWNVSSWFDSAGRMGPRGRRWFCDGQQPTDQEIIADFGFFDAAAGRYHTDAAGNWEHKALWVDPADGKLYVVSPQTGFLWCYETRGQETFFESVSAGGKTIPFYPVGERIPLCGTYPATNCRDRYPPVRWDTPRSGTNGATAMSSYLVPFKGGLLWWSASHHDGGAFGHPRYAFWRRVGYGGPWTVVTTPQEFAANTYSVVRNRIDNDEVVLLSGGGNSIDTQGPWPFFWRLT